VLHVPAISFDGLVGISPIRNCMQAFGLAIAAERFGAQFFGQGARATGVFTHPGALAPEAYQNLKASIQSWATGDQALRPIVLEEGLTWEQITISPEEAQFLETRRFQKSDIAAIFRVPLHLIQELARSTDNNIEHQSIEYVRHTLRPLAVRLEQEVNRKLLKDPFYCEHDLNEISRGDFASQTEGYQNLRNAGVYSANDIRRKLRENPLSSQEGGDVRLAPLNMTSLANLADPTFAAPAPPPAPGPRCSRPRDGSLGRDPGGVRGLRAAPHSRKPGRDLRRTRPRTNGPV
jgi:HK97 family phage portal protein